jgi:hypothetical protein
LPWARFETLLAAKIIEADPAAAEQQAKLWEAERFVRTGRTSEHGLKLLVARAEAGDVIWFMATVNRIADILHLEGSTDSADVRRAQAIGILAQPARAVELLWAHRDDQVHTDHPDLEPEPAEVDPDEPPEPPDTHQSLVVAEPKLDARRARPQVVLYVHLSEEALHAQLAGSTCGAGVGRIEDAGPVTIGQIQRFLGRTDAAIAVRPVLDPADTPPVDSYEIPRRVREALFLQAPASMFPWGTCTSRRMDLDHTIPYRPPCRGGPPGQTGVDTLGPFTRTEHRLKTHGRWRLRQPVAGVYLWRSPYGATYLVTNAGTQDLGENTFADTIWHAAAPRPQAIEAGLGSRCLSD